MRTILILILMGSLFSPATALSASASIVVSGHVEGHDGKMPPLAEVHLRGFDPGSPSYRDEAILGNGKFTLSLEPARSYMLTITAVGHDPVSLPLISFPDGDRISVDVRLASLPYLEKLDRLALIGDWQAWDFKNQVPMSKQPDGTWTAEVETARDSVAYEITGLVAGGRAVNGTQADRYQYDGGGDYHAILDAKPGRVIIRFDPAKLPKKHTDTLPRITFDKRHRGIIQQRDVLDAIDRYDRDVAMALRAHTKAGGSMETFQFKGSPAQASVEASYRTATDPVARDLAAAFLVVKASPTDSVTIRTYSGRLAPESPVWGISRFFRLFSVTASGRAGADKTAFIQMVLERNPNHRAQGMALALLTAEASERGDTTEVRAFHTRLKSDYADMKWELAFAFVDCDPNRAIQRGKPLPDFTVTLLDGGGALTRASLAGRYYLVDFWATWCGPCLAEMDNLHAAWEEFSSKGLGILSLSMDRTVDAVATFRRERWAMPWQNAYIGVSGQDGIIDRFEVTGIPKMILVGPDGVIIAAGAELQGPLLAKTLAANLDK